MAEEQTLREKRFQVISYYTLDQFKNKLLYNDSVKNTEKHNLIL